MVGGVLLHSISMFLEVRVHDITTFYCIFWGLMGQRSQHYKFHFQLCVYSETCPHRHCSYHGHSGLLEELILAVGYFSVLHPDNQVMNTTTTSDTCIFFGVLQTVHSRNKALTVSQILLSSLQTVHSRNKALTVSQILLSSELKAVVV